MKIEGKVEIWTIDKYGNKKKESETKNTIVTRGLKTLAENWIWVNSTNFIDYISVGTADNPTQLTDLDLYAEISGSRKQISSKTSTMVSATEYKLELKYTYGVTEANGTWKEVGLFYSTGSTMVARTVLATPFPKTSSYQAQVVYTLKVTI